MLRNICEGMIFSTFHLFILENQSLVIFVLQIYSGSEKLNDKLLLNVCGKKESKTIGFTSPIASINHQMLVVFETKQGYTSKGFSADFQMVSSYFIFLIQQLM